MGGWYDGGEKRHFLLASSTPGPLSPKGGGGGEKVYHHSSSSLSFLSRALKGGGVVLATGRDSPTVEGEVSF